jgi:hypothetical protein
MKTIFKIYQGNGTGNEFVMPSFIKENYNSLEDARVDLSKLLDEVKKEHSTVSDLRVRENWLDDFEPKQTEIFWIEILEFEVDEDGNEEEINFGIDKTEDYYI